MRFIKRNNGEARRLIRWSLTGAALVGLFWLGWYLLLGIMPQAREWWLGPTMTVPLPLVLPRWADCLIFPLWLPILFLLQQNGGITADLIKPLRQGLRIVFLVAMTVIGLSGTMGKFAIGAEIGIIWGTLIGGLTAGWRAGLGIGSANSLTAGLRAGAICALWAGLSIALIFGLVSGWLTVLVLAILILPTVAVGCVFKLLTR